jgi:hypothetical protein
LDFVTTVNSLRGRDRANPGFAVSNQKGESEIFLALNTRHLRREKFG